MSWAKDFGVTLQQTINPCRLSFSARPARAIIPANSVMCQIYIKAMDIPVYRQNIRTQGNGVITPQIKLKKLVNDVTVIDTAASLKHLE